MRIAITINTSWNIFNFRAGLIKALIAEGHEIFAIAPIDTYSTKLEALGCHFTPIKMQNTGVNPFNDLKLIFSLKKIYKAINPAIILQYTVKPNIYGSLAASTLGIPVINNVSGLGTVFLSNSPSSLIAKWLYKLSFRNVPLVFFQNQDDKNDFINGLSLPQLNFDLLPGSGVNLKKYLPQEKTPNESFVFLMIARVIIEKGINEYVEAAQIVKSQFPNVAFRLLGTFDPLHKRGLSERVFNNWLNQKIIIHLGEKEDVRDAIAEADCIVLPSYREGTPRTLLEAAAMAKPIVTTDVPGCREVVKHQFNGLLCQVKDANDLAAKMIEMIEIGHVKSTQMGQNGRKMIIEQFDEEIVIKKYIKQIANIIKQKTL